MTQRERQILQWIEQDPMISQEALAEKAGITRSSVAVHISNLMKKGYIAGKGYVLRSGTYAAVVGGVNMDIGGQSYGRPAPDDLYNGISWGKGFFVPYRAERKRALIRRRPDDGFRYAAAGCETEYSLSLWR